MFENSGFSQINWELKSGFQLYDVVLLHQLQHVRRKLASGACVNAFNRLGLYF